MCAVPALVMIAASGRAIDPSNAISPAALMPISTIAVRCSGSRRSKVRGTPQWLLRFPTVFSVGLRVESAADSAPWSWSSRAAGETDQHAVPRIRCRRASFCSASVTSSTTTRVPALTPGPVRVSDARAQRRGGAAREGLRQEHVPVDAASRKRHEQLARRQRAAVDRRALDPALEQRFARARLARHLADHEIALGHAGQAPQREGRQGRRHHRPPPPRRSSAATARSSKGSTRSPIV
jgi:hypothetical protein